MRKPDYDRRVVVTGLGVVSPVGNDVQTAWGNLVRGQSGLGEITKFDVSPVRGKAAGEVRDFDAGRLDGPEGRPPQRERDVVRRRRRQAGRSPTPASRSPTRTARRSGSSSAPAPAASS